MSALVAKPRFEDIVAEVDKEWYVKLPDRSAKIVMESPDFALFDDSGATHWNKLNKQRSKSLLRKPAPPRRLSKRSKKGLGLTRYLTSRMHRWLKLFRLV